MFCTKCGAKLEDGAAFCTSCGAPTDDAPAQMPADVTQRMSTVGSTPTAQVTPIAAADAATKSPKRAARIAIVVLVIAIIAALIAAAILLFGGQNDASKSSIDPAQTQATTDGASTDAAQNKTALDMYVSQVDNASFPKVTLYAHLADETGADVTSVDAGQFSVVEVGSDNSEHQASIEEIVPVSEGDAMNINLVLDQSGSMNSEGKMSNAKSAAYSFIDSITASGTSYAEITSFDDYVYNRQPFTTDQALLESAVSSLSPDGETALYDALYWALQRTNLKSGSRVVIAFTDGEENASTYSRADVEELSRLTGIPVYLVGIGDSINVSELESLATSCNGRYYDASTSDLADALERIYNSIYEDQRSMYRVVYTSSYDSDTSVYRTVRLICADDGPFAGTAETTYMPVDNVSMYDNSANSNDYVLPDSSSRYYSQSELEQLSLWELYLARNEIFARYGRGFKNQDLIDYFATRQWYNERYTPEEFDAMSSPLNDYERKNTEAMLAIEKERNSPYLVTAK